MSRERATSALKTVRFNTRAGGNFGGSVVDGPAIPDGNGVTGRLSTIDDKIFN